MWKRPSVGGLSGPRPIGVQASPFGLPPVRHPAAGISHSGILRSSIPIRAPTFTGLPFWHLPFTDLPIWHAPFTDLPIGHPPLGHATPCPAPRSSIAACERHRAYGFRGCCTAFTRHHWVHANKGTACRAPTPRHRPCADGWIVICPPPTRSGIPRPGTSCSSSTVGARHAVPCPAKRRSPCRCHAPGPA